MERVDASCRTLAGDSPREAEGDVAAMIDGLIQPGVFGWRIRGIYGIIHTSCGLSCEQPCGLVGWIYVGQAECCWSRLYAHNYALWNGSHHNRAFEKACRS